LNVIQLVDFESLLRYASIPGFTASISAFYRIMSMSTSNLTKKG